MVNYLLHIYRKGSLPFRSLSVLPENEALVIMQKLYLEGSVFWERFKDPKSYLHFRKQVEQTLRNGFKEKGGTPTDQCPIYLVVGSPKWMEAVCDSRTLETTETIRVPLSLVSQGNVSFTYPDSMVSAIMAMEKNPAYYEPEYHGKVFTLAEINQIISEKGLPEEGWETRMPRHYAHYIEAQVWDRQVLLEYYRTERPRGIDEIINVHNNSLEPTP